MQHSFLGTIKPPASELYKATVRSDQGQGSGVISKPSYSLISFLFLPFHSPVHRQSHLSLNFLDHHFLEASNLCSMKRLPTPKLRMDWILIESNRRLNVSIRSSPESFCCEKQSVQVFSSSENCLITISGLQDVIILFNCEGKKTSRPISWEN